MTNLGKLFVWLFLVIFLLFFSGHNCIPFRSRSRPTFWRLRLRLRANRFGGSGSGSDQNVSTPAAPAPAPAPHPWHELFHHSQKEQTVNTFENFVLPLAWKICSVNLDHETTFLTLCLTAKGSNIDTHTSEPWIKGCASLYITTTQEAASDRVCQDLRDLTGEWWRDRCDWPGSWGMEMHSVRLEECYSCFKHCSTTGKATKKGPPISNLKWFWIWKAFKSNMYHKMTSGRICISV